MLYRYNCLSLNRDETIHQPHDLMRIAVFNFDTVIFDMIRSCKMELKRKYFFPKNVFNNKKLGNANNDHKFIFSH
jgi:hypothetical protein